MRDYRRYPEYKESGTCLRQAERGRQVEWLGEIPAHWEIRRCGSTAVSSQDGVRGNEAEIEKLEGEIIDMLQEVAE